MDIDSRSFEIPTDPYLLVDIFEALPVQMKSVRGSFSGQEDHKSGVIDFELQIRGENIFADPWAPNTLSIITEWALKGFKGHLIFAPKKFGAGSIMINWDQPNDLVPGHTHFISIDPAEFTESMLDFCLQNKFPEIKG